MERYNADCLIIGGGVSGLAIGSRLAKRFENIFIVERNSSLGQETSSRNSEVIHAGIEILRPWGETSYLELQRTPKVSPGDPPGIPTGLGDSSGTSKGPPKDP